LINRIEIADGLKELLICSGFTVKSLLNTSTSDFAKILGIDEYVAKLLSDADVLKSSIFCQLHFLPTSL
jgi:hypothetical protein